MLLSYSLVLKFCTLFHCLFFFKIKNSHKKLEELTKTIQNTNEKILKIHLTRRYQTDVPEINNSIEYTNSRSDQYEEKVLGLKDRLETQDQYTDIPKTKRDPRKLIEWMLEDTKTNLRLSQRKIREHHTCNKIFGCRYNSRKNPSMGKK